MFQHTAARRRLELPLVGISIQAGFNTQPPEGGWILCLTSDDCIVEFQHTAARRRLACEDMVSIQRTSVSTHSRPKAAGQCCFYEIQACFVSTHSRPKAAGTLQPHAVRFAWVSTHSRPKAAGCHFVLTGSWHDVFQHTAARRRLAVQALIRSFRSFGFNTQPPEGGWLLTANVAE